MAGKKHPGFKAVQKKIAARSGVSMQAAGAILASSSRKASAAAKKKNPRLKRVDGPSKTRATPPTPLTVRASSRRRSF